MKLLKIFLMIFLYLTKIRTEYLHFVDNIDPDSDCESIRKLHPEMKIVCQDNTESSDKQKYNSHSEKNSKDSPSPLKNLKEKDQSSSSVDSIMAAENDIINKIPSLMNELSDNKSNDFSNNKETSNNKINDPPLFDYNNDKHSYSIDSIMSEENKLLNNFNLDKTKNTPKNTNINQKGPIVISEPFKAPNSSISTENNNLDLDSMLKNLEETTAKTAVDPQLKSLMNKIDKSQFIDLKNSQKNTEKNIESKEKKITTTQDSKGNYEGIKENKKKENNNEYNNNNNENLKEINKDYRNDEKQEYINDVHESKNIEAPSFPQTFKTNSKSSNKMLQKRPEDFIFKEKTSQIDDSDDSFNENTNKNNDEVLKNEINNLKDLIQQINIEIKNLNPEQNNLRLKENMNLNMKNIQDSVNKNNNDLIVKIDNLFKNIQEINNGQKTLQKQMEELNQNQKNLLKFLQNKYESKENVKNEESIKSKGIIEKKEEITKQVIQKIPEKIDYKNKLVSLLELIKKEMN